MSLTTLPVYVLLPLLAVAAFVQNMAFTAVSSVLPWHVVVDQ